MSQDGDPGVGGDGPAPDARRSAERLHRRTVYEGRVVDLAVERVRLPNGRETDLELVHFAGAAAVVPLLTGEAGEEQVVMIRQYRHATGGWLLEIPAGKLDDGEAPETCARRELTEETGYEAAELEPLGWIWSTPGAADERIWLFAARGLRAGDAAPEQDEVIETVCVPLEEAIRRAASGELHDAKTVCALLRLGRHGAA